MRQPPRRAGHREYRLASTAYHSGHRGERGECEVDVGFGQRELARFREHGFDHGKPLRPRRGLPQHVDKRNGSRVAGLVDEVTEAGDPLAPPEQVPHDPRRGGRLAGRCQHYLGATNRDGAQTARTGLSKFGKTMVNFYLAKLGVAQSEIGFPFLFHEVPYVRASVALAQAGAFGTLRLSGWCRAVTTDVERAIPLGLSHYNLSISTSDQMIAHKFRGRLDRSAIIKEMTAAVTAAKDGGAQTIGVNAGQDAWVNTCVNGIGERSGNADLLSCILAFRHGFGVAEIADIGDPIDLSWARRFALWASYAFGQPLPQNQPGTGRNAFAHESGIHADGALKDRSNYELYHDDALGPFPQDWRAQSGRVVLTGEYGGMAGFRHVMGGLGIDASADEELIFQLVQLGAAATGKPLTDDELRLIAGYPRELSLLYPGQLG